MKVRFAVSSASPVSVQQSCTSSLRCERGLRPSWRVDVTGGFC